MTSVYDENFCINQNIYKILLVHTRPTSGITIYRNAFVENKTKLFSISILRIEEGDIVWNSIVKNQVRMTSCFQHFKNYACFFDKKYPDPLIFKTYKKLLHFGSKICEQPITLTSKGYSYHSETIKKVF